MDFDYKNLQDAAFNRTPARLPLYEHIVSNETMEAVLNRQFMDLFKGDLKDKEEYFKNVCDFFIKMGYDTVSYECCIGRVMPHNGLLAGQGESVIKTYEDFEKYPWDEIHENFFKNFGDNFAALGNVMPEGLKAVGGAGNGVFECVQEVIGFANLAFISVDDPELYKALFKKVGEVNLSIWKSFMERYGDLYCVLRFGDDLGFKTNTLLSVQDIRNYIVPEYAKIVDLVHSYNKPFLLHSCGWIFDIMPDLIDTVKIDAKHSNEDQIAMFPHWVEEYGDKIGNFGGIDTDAVCRLSIPEIKEYVLDVLNQCKNKKGIAFGSGNSIPSYVPVENYMEMVNTVREYRGS